MLQCAHFIVQAVLSYGSIASEYKVGFKLHLKYSIILFPGRQRMYI